MLLTARNYYNTNIYIYIPKNLPETESYYFNNSPGVGYGLNSPDYPHAFAVINDIKYLSYENSGLIDFLKTDFDSKIYSGTFSLKLKNENDQDDILEISEGRFDINLITLNQD